MNTMELDARKAELAREVLNETDEEMVIRMIASIRKVKNIATAPPCQFTPDELRGQIDRALEDARTGNYVSHEEMLNKHPRP